MKQANIIIPLLIFLVATLNFYYGENHTINSIEKANLLLYLLLAVLSVFSLIIFFKFKKNKSDEIKKLNQINDDLSKQLKEEKLRYADKIPSLIAEISKFVNEDEKKKFKVSTQILVNEIANIFNEIKNVECCVTLKVFTKKEIMLKTLCRSNSSGRVNRETYIDVKKYYSLDRFLSDNTDLDLMAKADGDNYEGKDLTFYSNDLINCSGYRHPLLLKQDQSGSSYHDKMNNFVGNEDEKENFKVSEWPLPYKSTITAPLCYMRQNIDSDKFFLAGTLCIDFNETNVLNEDIDIPIIQTMAETLYINYNSALKKGVDIVN